MPRGLWLMGTRKRGFRALEGHSTATSLSHRLCTCHPHPGGSFSSVVKHRVQGRKHSLVRVNPVCAQAAAFSQRPPSRGRLIKHTHPCEATATGRQGCAYHLFSKPCGYPDPGSRTDLGAQTQCGRAGPPQTPHLQSALLSTKPREK